MKKLFKKALTIALSGTLLLTAMLISASAEEVTELPAPSYTMGATIGAKWYFGNDRTTPFTSQGQNGFYAMYSTEVNQGKSFPVETAKLCEYDSTDYYFKIPDGLEGYREHFKIASSQSGHGTSTAFTKAVELADNYSAVIKWVAPKNGQYWVEQWWRCNSAGVFTANNDGVIVAIYKGTENIFYHDQIENIADYNSHITAFEKTKSDGLITLKQGEALYFVSDPKTNGYESLENRAYDAPWTQISIEYRGNAKDSATAAAPTYTSTEIGTTYSFGANSTGFTKEGGDGFYAMYSRAINKGNSFPLDSLFYCKPITTDTAYFGIPLWQQDANGGTVYVPNFQIGSANWFGNTNNHAAIRLSNGYSAVIKWVAPRAGDYSLNAQWKGDGWGRITVNNDGTTVGVYTDRKNLYSLSTVDRVTTSDGVIPSYNSNGTISLEEGEALYFVADPETIGYNDSTHYDSPFVDIDIKLEANMTGDVRTDGKLNLLDIVAMKKLYVDDNASGNEYADVNKNNVFDVDDIVALVKILLDR